MAYRYNNPALSRLSNFEYSEDEARASYQGIAIKSVIYILLTLVAAAVSFALALPIAQSAGWFLFVVIGAPVLAFVFGMIANFAPGTAKVTGSIYAVLMGLSVGFISAIIGEAYGGVVFAALLGTVIVFGVTTGLYASGKIRATPFFRKFMLCALIGIVVLQLAMIIITLITGNWNIFYGTSWLSIGVSVIMVIIASLCILLDLDRMTMMVESGMDKKYEWSAAFGLLVTLIWLYMEFLRLFSKIAGKRK